MKIRLVGRPGKVVQRGATAITVLESRRAPEVSNDLPEPPEMAVRYTVYMAEKQWRQVEAALRDPRDVLMIEGYCYYDAELQGLAVLARKVTTRQAQKSEGRSGPSRSRF